MAARKASPFRMTRYSVFSKSLTHYNGLKAEASLALKKHQRVGYRPASDTHIGNKAYMMAHIDKGTKALTRLFCYRFHWFSNEQLATIVERNTPNVLHRTQVVKKERNRLTEVQKATCDVVFRVMFRLYHIQGEEACLDTMPLSTRAQK